MNSSISSSGAQVSGWVLFWLVFSSLVVYWDGCFIVNRPHSFKGGSLSHIWPGYENYYTTDKLYADTENGFIKAQTAMNFVESTLNILSVVLYATKRVDSVRGPILMIIFLTCTLAKTALYMAHEQLHHPHPTTHNSWSTYFWCYLFPNGFWIVCPTLSILHLIKLVEQQASGRTHTAGHANSGSANSKKIK